MLDRQAGALVAIAQEVARRGGVRDGLHDRLGPPVRARVLDHVEVDDGPARLAQRARMRRTVTISVTIEETVSEVLENGGGGRNRTSDTGLMRTTAATTPLRNDA